MASPTNATSSWGPARTRTGMASPMSANCARIPLVRWVCAWRLLHRRCCPIPAAWIRTASSLSRPPRGERPLSAHGYVSSACGSRCARPSSGTVAYCLYLKLVHFAAMVAPVVRTRGGRPAPILSEARGGFSPAPVFLVGWRGAMRRHDAVVKRNGARPRDDRQRGTTINARRLSTQYDPQPPHGPRRALAGTLHAGTRGARFGAPAWLPQGGDVDIC